MDQDLRQYVVLRDDGCVARFVNSAFWASRWPMLQGLPSPGLCRNEFGGDINPRSLIGLQVDHVKHADEHAMGLKAPDDPDHLWTMCPGHHTEPGGSGVPGRVWATMSVVREAAVEYIAAANEAARLRGWPIRPAKVGG